MKSKEELLRYNQDIRSEMLKGYVHLRGYIMQHTLDFIEADEYLSGKVSFSKANQKIVYAEEPLDFFDEVGTSDISIVNRRSFEALPLASGKVAVLNFANAFSPGGAPFRGSAQEESLCHCSTLLPCLYDVQKEFYDKHKKEGNEGKIGCLGSDDMIYTPGVVQFKTDAKVQLLLEKKDYREADIITCAAPDLRLANRINKSEYSKVVANRIHRILSLAKKEGVNTLILGAWGCGVFANPAPLVAACFHDSLRHLRFDKVIFAIVDYSTLGEIHQAFQEEFNLELLA